MPQHASEHTGTRIKHYRKLRDLTQIELAELSRVSYGMIKKIEQGERGATPEIVAAVARALGVAVTELTGQPYMAELQQDRLDALIEPIREALDLYDLGADSEVAPRPLVALSSHAEELCAKVRQAHLRDVAAALPALITETTTAAHAAPSTEGWQTLASTYRTAYDVATKLGFADLCQVALDRMEWAAERASDPVIAGLRQYLRSLSYLRSGHYRTGDRLVTVGLQTLDQADAGRVRDVATGQLHLGAAVIAARAQDGARAREHLALADRFAERTGPAEKVHWLSFGPVNVAVHRVSALAELREYQVAVETAASIIVPPTWPATRRAHHLTELANAQLQAGHGEAALRDLSQARRIAPQQVRYHPMTRDIVVGLIARRRAVPRKVATLASWIGL